MSKSSSENILTEKQNILAQNEEELLKKILQDNAIQTSHAQDMLRMVLSGSASSDKFETYQNTIKELESKKNLLNRDKTKLNNNKSWFKIQEEVKNFIDMLLTNGLEVKKVADILLPFADPTFDTTFKMLFGSKEHDEILISLLNNLLEFSGDNEIKELEIITEKLETPIFSYEKGVSSVTGAVDVLCTTATNQKIAVEMQRAKQPYFLARTQHYMSKLISVQVNEKSGQEYHKKILDTYILVLEKQNLFTGDHKLSDDSLYEIEVEPMVKQTQEAFPGNKMHWKFFELSKFREHNDYKNLNKDSDLKHQWLEFLIDCSYKLSEPDRHELIKQGYDIMKMAKWDGDKQALYWKEQMRELDAIEYQKEELKKAEEDGFNKGIKIQKAKEDIKKYKEFKTKQPMLEGKTEQELKLLKDMGMFIDQEEVIQSFEILQQKHTPTIDQYMEDTPTEIIGHLSDMEMD